MDNRKSIRDFLVSRRANIAPSQAGLPDFGGIRRVPGLRRQEVAMLAGVSIDYYTKVERGYLAGVSHTVLDAIAQALHLNEEEREHLFDLARSSAPATRKRRQPAQAIPPSIQGVLDSMVGVPAFVQNGRLDVVAINDLGRALYSPAFGDSKRPTNFAQFAFLDPDSESFYGDWDSAADTAVALLQAQAGHTPFDKELIDLVGELSTRSEDFRQRWARQDVRGHLSGVKTFRHPVVGDLEVHFNAFELPAFPRMSMITYTAEPASASGDALQLLASWAATAKEGDLPEVQKDAHTAGSPNRSRLD